jgi:hypothetical protein
VPGHRGRDERPVHRGTDRRHQVHHTSTYLLMSTTTNVGACCCSPAGTCTGCQNFTGLVIPPGGTCGTTTETAPPCNITTTSAPCGCESGNISTLISGPCSGSVFTNAGYEAPEQYASCTCLLLASACSTSSINCVFGEDPNNPICSKRIGIIKYRTWVYVFNEAECAWIRLSELPEDIRFTNCDGFGDCACPDPPDCDAPGCQYSWPAPNCDCANPFP